MLSRVADHLYWMSRYLERAEHTARVLDVFLNRALETAPGAADGRLVRLLRGLDIQPIPEHLDVQEMLQRLTFDSSYSGSIVFNLTGARENARHIREQISSEMWMEINQLYLEVRHTDRALGWLNEPHPFYVGVKDGAHLFQGITDATMNHNQGWHFIQIGRYVERLINLVNFLNAQLPRHFSESPESDQPVERYFDLVALLKSFSAFEAFCKVYNPDMQPERIAEFLLFNAEFPRSARFCVDTLFSSLNSLADATMRHKNLKVNRVAGRLQSILSFDEVEDVLSTGFSAYLTGMKQQAYQIHDALFDTYISYPIEAALTN
ncbi:MAG: alpha-E domain-containing protein [Anaerolineae bacterium]|nr:alpha-E domain-containing protein [Anaerolineae bacterium]